MPLRIEVVDSGPFTLGESPLWDHRINRLYWIDSLACTIHCLVPESGLRLRWTAPERVGSIGLRASGGLIVATRKGFMGFDPESGEFEFLIDPETGRDGNRLNDGKCDGRGRYWCGSMDEALAEPNGTLWRLDPDLGCHAMESGIIVSNGIAWSPDDRTMYFADSRAETLYAYDFDIDSGSIGNRRVLVSFKGRQGRTDGATVDRAGNYWCALVHGWTVGCFAPDGRLIREIRLPVRHPTMCSFGGPDLDILYVTSATFLLDPGEAADQPLAGALFAVHGLEDRGIAEPEFAG